jgi:hypothetical protein
MTFISRCCDSFPPLAARKVSRWLGLMLSRSPTPPISPSGLAASWGLRNEMFQKMKRKVSPLISPRTGMYLGKAGRYSWRLRSGGFGFRSTDRAAFTYRSVQQDGAAMVSGMCPRLSVHRRLPLHRSRLHLLSFLQPRRGGGAARWPFHASSSRFRAEAWEQGAAGRYGNFRPATLRGGAALCRGVVPIFSTFERKYKWHIYGQRQT